MMSRHFYTFNHERVARTSLVPRVVSVNYKLEAGGEALALRDWKGWNLGRLYTALPRT